MQLAKQVSEKQDQSALGVVGKSRSSLWKENFKRRQEMGMEQYNQLSKADKQAINKEIKKEFRHCSWAKCKHKHGKGEGSAGKRQRSPGYLSTGHSNQSDLRH